MKETSFRKFKRLTEKEKRIFTRSKLEPAIKSLAINYSFVTNQPLRDCLKWARNNWKDHTISSPYSPTPEPYLKAKVAIREFIFRGFIPVSEFEMIPELAYIMTNINIHGKSLIYPKHFAYTREDTDKGYPWVYNELGKYGIQNYTQIYVNTINNGNKTKRRK